MPLFRPDVKKRDNRLEKFDDQKLIDSIKRACVRRPIRNDQLDEVINELIEQIKTYEKLEINIAKLVDWVVAEISQLDKIAAMRYASQYKDFSSADQIQQYWVDILK